MSIGEILKREPESKVGPGKKSGSFRERGAPEPMPPGGDANSAEMDKYREAIREEVSAYLDEHKLYASAAFADELQRHRIAREFQIPIAEVDRALKYIAQNVKPSWKLGSHEDRK
jgi:hypothetical protein